MSYLTYGLLWYILSVGMRGFIEGSMNFILGYGMRLVITYCTEVFIDPLNRRGAVKDDMDWAISSFIFE